MALQTNGSINANVKAAQPNAAALAHEALQFAKTVGAQVSGGASGATTTQASGGNVTINQTFLSQAAPATTADTSAPAGFSSFAGAIEELRSSMEMLSEATQHQIDQTRQFAQWQSQLESLMSGSSKYLNPQTGLAKGQDAVDWLLGAVPGKAGTPSMSRILSQRADQMAEALQADGIDPGAKWVATAKALAGIASSAERTLSWKSEDLGRRELLGEITPDEYKQGMTGVWQEFVDNMMGVMTNSQKNFEKAFQTNLLGSEKAKEQQSRAEEKAEKQEQRADEQVKNAQIAAAEQAEKAAKAERRAEHKEQMAPQTQQPQQQAAKDVNINAKGNTTVNNNSGKAPEIKNSSEQTNGANTPKAERKAAQANQEFLDAAKKMDQSGGTSAPKVEKQAAQATEDLAKSVKDMGTAPKSGGGGGTPTPPTPPTPPATPPSGGGGGGPNDQTYRYFASKQELTDYLAGRGLTSTVSEINKALGDLDSNAKNIKGEFKDGDLVGISLTAASKQFGGLERATLNYRFGQQFNDPLDPTAGTHIAQIGDAAVTTLADAARIEKESSNLQMDMMTAQQRVNALLARDIVKETDVNGNPGLLNNRVMSAIAGFGQVDQATGSFKIGDLTRDNLNSLTEKLDGVDQYISQLNQLMPKQMAGQSIENYNKRAGQIMTGAQTMVDQFGKLGIDITKQGATTRDKSAAGEVGRLYDEYKQAEKNFGAAKGDIEGRVGYLRQMADLQSQLQNALKAETTANSRAMSEMRLQNRVEDTKRNAQAALDAKNADKLSQSGALNTALKALDAAKTPLETAKAIHAVQNAARDLTKATAEYNKGQSQTDRQQQKMGGRDYQLSKMSEKLQKQGIAQPQSLTDARNAMDNYKRSKDPEKREQYAKAVEDNYRKAMDDSRETLKVGQKIRAQEDKISKATTKAEDMLTDPRLAASSKEAQALQSALYRMQSAHGSSPANTLSIRGGAFENLNEALAGGSKALSQFEKDATAAEQQYASLLKNDMFKGLAGAQQIAVGDAFKAFQQSRSAANLEALQKELGFADNLIDLHRHHNDAEGLRQQLGRASDRLKEAEGRAGGQDKWTNEQKSVFADANKYYGEAASAIQKGNFEQAGDSLKNFGLAMSRLTPMLTQAEQATNKAAQAQQKSIDETIKQGSAVEKNKYYDQINPKTREAMVQAGEALKASTSENVKANTEAYEKATKNVQWAEMAKQAEDYNAQISKIGATTAAMEKTGAGGNWLNIQRQQYQELLDLQNQLTNAQKGGDMTKAQGLLGNMGTKLDDYTKTAKEAEAIQKSMEKFESNKNFSRLGEEIKNTYNEAKQALTEATSPEQFTNALGQMAGALKGVKNGLDEIANNDTWAQQTAKMDAFQTKLQGMMSRNGGVEKWNQGQAGLLGTAQRELDAAQTAKTQGNLGESQMHLKAAEDAAKTLNTSLRETNSLSATAATRMDGLTRTMMMMATPMMMWRRFTGYMKKAAQNVSAIDSQMADLKKVTQNTNAEYQQFLDSSGKNAVAIGSSISDLVATTSTFAHMGYGLRQSQELGVTATKFANVGNFSNTTEAADAIIAVIKGFDDLDIKDAESVGDKLTAVANNYAVTANDIAEGLTKSASALNVAGNNVDQSAAMITAIAETTRDAGAAGSALKVLSMRIRGAKSELTDAGESTDGMAESTSKLRAQVKALTNVDGKGGVDILADKDTFRSTYDIMKDIAGVWKDMSDIDQSALLELLAGKVRSNQAAALLQNFDTAERALQTSLNSEGTMNQVHQRWMDTIEARQSQFNAAKETASMAALPTNTLKGLYQTGAAAMSGLTWLLNQVGGGGGLFAGIMAVASAMRSGGGSIAAGLGNITGLHAGGTGLFGLSKANKGWINNYNAAFTTAMSQEGMTADVARGMAKTQANAQLKAGQTLDKYTESLADNSQGVIDASKANSTFVMSMKSLGKNVLSAVGTFAAVELAMVGLSKLWGWFDSEVLHKGDTLAKRADESYASLNSTLQESADIQSKRQTTQSRIDELSSKSSLTSAERKELADLQAQMREMQYQQNLVNMRARNEARQTMEDTLESYRHDTRGQRNIDSVYYEGAAETAFKELGDGNFAESDAMWDAAISNAMRAGADDYILSLMQDYRNVGPSSLMYNSEARRLMQQYNPEHGQPGASGLAQAIETLTAGYANQYSGDNAKNIAELRARTEATTDMMRQIQEENFTAEATAQAYTDAKAQYDAVMQLAEKTPEAAETLGDIDAYKDFVSNWEQFGSFISTKATDLEGRIVNSLASMDTLEAQGGTEYAEEVQGMISDYLALREAIQPGSKYDAINKLLSGTTMKDAVSSLQELAAESEITAEDISKIEVDGIKNAGTHLSWLLSLFGVTLDDFAGMINSSMKKSDKDSSGGGKAKVDVVAENRARLDSINKAETAASTLWSKTGYTGMMSEENYKELAAIDNGAYLSAVRYANGGLFFDRDAFDDIVQQKYQEELKQLRSDVADKQKEYSEQAEKLMGKINGNGTESEISQGISDLITTGTQLQNLRRMSAQAGAYSSAYAQWLRNKEGPESGDEFDEMTTAVQTLHNARSSKRIGTNAVSAALDFVAGGLGFNDLNDADWALMGKLFPGEREIQQLKNKYGTWTEKQSAAYHTSQLRNFQDQMIEAGILNKDRSWATGADGKPLTLGEAAQMYNNRYGTKMVNSTLLEAILGEMNEFFLDGQKYEISGEAREEAKNNLLDASKNLDKALTDYKNDKSESNKQALESAYKAYQDALNGFQGTADAAASAASELAAAQEKEKSDANADLIGAMKEVADATRENTAAITGKSTQENQDEKDKEEQTGQNRRQAQRAADASAAEQTAASQGKIPQIEGSSNVKLTTRKRVSGSEMQAAGWGEFAEGDYATLFTSTTTGSGKTVLATPITADGTVLTPEEFDNYLGDLLAGAKTLADVFEMDKLDNGGKGLVIAGAEGESQKTINAVSKYGELLHNSQEEMVDAEQDLTPSDIEHMQRQVEAELQTQRQNLNPDTSGSNESEMGENITETVDDSQPLSNPEVSRAVQGIQSLTDNLNHGIALTPEMMQQIEQQRQEAEQMYDQTLGNGDIDNAVVLEDNLTELSEAVDNATTTTEALQQAQETQALAESTGQTDLIPPEMASLVESIQNAYTEGQGKRAAEEAQVLTAVSQEARQAVEGFLMGQANDALNNLNDLRDNAWQLTSAQQRTLSGMSDAEVFQETEQRIVDAMKNGDFQALPGLIAAAQGLYNTIVGTKPNQADIAEAEAVDREKKRGADTDAAERNAEDQAMVDQRLRNNQELHDNALALQEQASAVTQELQGIKGLESGIKGVSSAAQELGQALETGSAEDIKTATANLQAQIDSLVEASGPAIETAEQIDALGQSSEGLIEQATDLSQTLYKNGNEAGAGELDGAIEALTSAFDSGDLQAAKTALSELRAAVDAATQAENDRVAAEQAAAKKAAEEERARLAEEAARAEAAAQEQATKSNLQSQREAIEEYIGTLSEQVSEQEGAEGLLSQLSGVVDGLNEAFATGDLRTMQNAIATAQQALNNIATNYERVKGESSSADLENQEKADAQARADAEAASQEIHKTTRDHIAEIQAYYQEQQRLAAEQTAAEQAAAEQEAAEAAARANEEQNIIDAGNAAFEQGAKYDDDQVNALREQLSDELDSGYSPETIKSLTDQLVARMQELDQQAEESATSAEPAPEPGKTAEQEIAEKMTMPPTKDTVTIPSEVIDGLKYPGEWGASSGEEGTFSDEAGAPKSVETKTIEVEAETAEVTNESEMTEAPAPAPASAGKTPMTMDGLQALAQTTRGQLEQFEDGTDANGNPLSQDSGLALFDAINALSSAMNGDNMQALSDAIATAQSFITEHGGQVEQPVQQGTMTIDTEFGAINLPDIPPAELEVETDMSQAQSDINSLGGSTTVTVNADASPARNEIASLGGSVTVTVVTERVDNSSGGPSNLNNTTNMLNAEGTSDAEAGVSLVDEQGSELIEHVSRGTFELGSNNGPRFTRLDAGDVVHTAQETKKILRRGRGKGRFGQSFALGTQNTVMPDGSGSRTQTNVTVYADNLTVSGKPNDGVPNRAQFDYEWAHQYDQYAADSQWNAISNHSKDKTGANAFLEVMKKIIDWIPTFLNVLKKKTSEFIAVSERAIDYIAQNKLVDSAIENVAAEIQANIDAVLRYRDFLSSNRRTLGLSDEDIAKIQNGTIDIESYNDETTVKAIKQYQAYWDKLVACRDALTTLNKQMQELSAQKLSNVVSYFEQTKSLLDDQKQTFESLIELKKQYGEELKIGDYVDSLSILEQTLTNAQSEEAALMAELSEQLGVSTDVLTAVLKSGKDVWQEISKYTIDELNYDDFGTTLIDAISGVPREDGQSAASYLNSLMNATKDFRKDPSIIDTAARSQGLDAFGATHVQNSPWELITSTDGSTRYKPAWEPGMSVATYLQQSFAELQNANSYNYAGKPIDLSGLKAPTIPVEPPSDEDIIKIGQSMGLAMADGSEEALKNFEAIKSLMTISWDTPLTVGSETWYTYMSTLEQLRSTINETKTEISTMNDEIAKIPLTNLQTGYKYLDEIQEELEAINSLTKAQGKSAYANTYKSLISNGFKQIENLEEQNKLIKAQMDALDPLSEKYQELYDDLRDNAQTIHSIKEDQEEWNDAIIDLQIDRLRKQNNQYKEQVQLMKALNDLEDAKQRRVLMYHDVGGFRYEVDEDALESAQEAASDAITSATINALEDQKEQQNIYGPLGERLTSGTSIVDSLGNTLVPVEDKLSALDFAPYYQSILAGVEQSGLLTSVLNAIDMTKLLEGAIGGDINIDISGMTLNGISDTQELGNAIIQQLPNYLLQYLYQKGA